MVRNRRKIDNIVRKMVMVGLRSSAKYTAPVAHRNECSPKAVARSPW